MTNVATRSKPLTEVGAVLARGYLRLLATRQGAARNLACLPKVTDIRNRQNCLDVGAQQSVNWVENDGDGNA